MIYESSWYAKVLVAVLLASPGSAQPVPEDNVHVMGSLDVQQILHSTKRFLRPGVDAKTIGLDFQNLVAKIRQYMSPVVAQAQDISRLRTRFEEMGLNGIKADNLPENAAFYEYIEEVMAKDSSTIEGVFLLLSQHCNDDAKLAKLLFRLSKSDNNDDPTESMQARASFGKELFDMQISRWSKYAEFYKIYDLRWGTDKEYAKS